MSPPFAARSHRRTPSTPPPVGPGADRRPAAAILLLLLVGSLALNLWGNRWGAPKPWHPDELTRRAMTMASERDLNPHFFAYGGTHFYTLIAGSLVPVRLYEAVFDPDQASEGTPARERWLARHDARVFQMARSVSGVLSALLVGITFLMAGALFGRRRALLAGIVVAISPGLVWIAHFATVDPAANFWYWLACLSAVLVLRDGRTRWYVVATLFAGIAIGTKVDRFPIIFPLVLAHALRGRGVQPRKLLLMAALIPVGFVVANPALILAPFEFLDGFTRDLFFNALRENENGLSYLYIFEGLRNALGWPLFILALLGVGHGFVDVVRGRDRRELILLFSAFLPYYLLFGAKLIMSWYVVLFLPALAILTARMIVDAAESLPRGAAWVPHAAVGIAVIVAALRTLALLAQFAHDSRYSAAAWIESHVPAGASVAMLPGGPAISAERYRIIVAQPDQHFASSLRERLDASPVYRSIRSRIFEAERWAGRALGTPVRERGYIAWFDPIDANATAVRSSRFRGADYVLVVDNREPDVLEALSSSASGYRKVATLHYEPPIPIDVEFMFVNPPISIWQARRSSSGMR